MVWVLGLHGLSALVEDEDGTGSFGKLEHVVAHAGDAGSEGWLGAFRQCGLVEQAVVAVVLKLSAPDAPEAAIDGGVVVFEEAGVDAVGAADGVGLRDEGPFGAVADGDAEAEDVGIVFGAEDEVVASVMFYYVVIPELARCPGDVVEVEDASEVGGFATGGVVEAEAVVVAHVEVVAVVVLAYMGVDVVGRVDVYGVCKDVGRGVCHVVGREEVTGVHRVFLCSILRFMSSMTSSVSS